MRNNTIVKILHLSPRFKCFPCNNFYIISTRLFGSSPHLPTLTTYISHLVTVLYLCRYCYCASAMAGITGAHVVPPKEAHRYTMIFLHGRDDDPTQFPESVLESETSAPKRELPDVFPSMKWVFPASRTRETVRFKTTMVQVSRVNSLHAVYHC